MSFFTTTFETIEIDEQNSITVKAPTYGTMQDVQGKSMAVRFDQKGVGVADLDITRMERLTVYSAIVSWDGPGFEGRPVNPENIDALPVFVIDKIKPAIDRLSSPMKAAEKKS